VPGGTTLATAGSQDTLSITGAGIEIADLRTVTQTAADYGHGCSCFDGLGGG
jgi:hypothetical protein